MREKTPTVCLVGLATLDMITDEEGSELHSVGFGGVCTNMARVFGALGIATEYFTPRYDGEIGRLFRTELDAHCVKWNSMSVEAPIAFFTARIAKNGELVSECFRDFGAASRIDHLSLNLLDEIGYSPSVFVASANIPLAGLNAIRSNCAKWGVKFCLVMTSGKEIDRIRGMEGRVDFLSLNIGELSSVTDKLIESLNDIATAAAALVTERGEGLVTLGTRGLIVVDRYRGEAWHQTVPGIMVRNPVAAGDVLTAAVLAERMSGKSWKRALPSAIRKVLSFLARERKTEYPFKTVCTNWSGKLTGPKAISGDR